MILLWGMMLGFLIPRFSEAEIQPRFRKEVLTSYHLWYWNRMLGKWVPAPQRTVMNRRQAQKYREKLGGYRTKHVPAWLVNFMSLQGGQRGQDVHAKRTQYVF
jgi:hypothetical protein